MHISLLSCLFSQIINGWACRCTEGSGAGCEWSHAISLASCLSGIISQRMLPRESEILQGGIKIPPLETCTFMEREIMWLLFRLCLLRIFSDRLLNFKSFWWQTRLCRVRRKKFLEKGKKNWEIVLCMLTSMKGRKRRKCLILFEEIHEWAVSAGDCLVPSHGIEQGLVSITAGWMISVVFQADFAAEANCEGRCRSWHNNIRFYP